AGHTNVGKSALLNALSGSQVEVDDRMFSTLSTTTRSLPGPVNQILLTDTVGFIRNLPPDLIDAFNSTLEEIFQADLVLLVFDVSEKEDIIREKLLSSLDILTPEVNTRALLLVGNKVDLLSGARRNDVEALIDREFRGRTLFLVSAKTGEGLDELINRIAGLQDYSYAIDITVPQTNEVYSLLSRLRSIAKIELVSSESILRIRILCRSEDRQKIEGWIRAVDGQIISAHDNSPSALSERNTPPQEDKGALSFARPP
ncbi:MAG: GTPase HflX, partial [Candidatus Thermoplasmatota archaeon]|nr:GTPase HflX [Candidatus Thermoplasmatota archaeon]